MSNMIGGLHATIRNNADFGYYKISGTVTKLGVVGKYTVLLYNRVTFLPILLTKSDAAGIYQFNYVKYYANGYFAVAFDNTNPLLNAAIADLITPEPIP